MDMSLDQPTPIKRFWRTWRREIVRGSVLFGIVVGVGLFFRNVTRNIKDHLPSGLGALGAFGDMEWGNGEGGNLFGHGRNVGSEWHYHVKMKPPQRSMAASKPTCRRSATVTCGSPPSTVP